MSNPLRNRLLRTLPPDDLALLTPHLVNVPLSKGDVVIRPYEPFSHAYFPESGLSSIISETNNGSNAASRSACSGRRAW
jgi:hypothetical protein